MGIIILFVIVVAIIGAIINNRNNRRRLERLKLHYDQALKGSNKKTALDAGRAYYSALRKNNVLTIYDEQAITNDLTAMGNHAIHL